MSPKGKYVGGGWSPERRAKHAATLAAKREAAKKLEQLPVSSEQASNGVARKLELVNKILDAPDNILDTVEKILKVA